MRCRHPCTARQFRVRIHARTSSSLSPMPEINRKCLLGSRKGLRLYRVWRMAAKVPLARPSRFVSHRAAIRHLHLREMRGETPVSQSWRLPKITRRSMTGVWTSGVQQLPIQCHHTITHDPEHLLPADTRSTDQSGVLDSTRSRFNHIYSTSLLRRIRYFAGNNVRAPPSTILVNIVPSNSCGRPSSL